jgi:NAD(P)-dependent dehydrogenase (short-subunit alcohol dehydrogenase family)
MTTPQQPLGSGYGPASTAREIIGSTRLAGKTAIVTGGYSGLGLETARTLAEAGATVIVPARDVGKASAAVANIPGITLEPLDLMEPDSIDAFADRFLASGRPLHLLINSAGIMATPLIRDARGNEAQFSTNHLGHFRLTLRLWPALVQAGGARVVAVSSRGHQIAPVDFDDVNFERRPYDKWIAYGQSKTANVLFAVKLDEIGARFGIRAFSLHPGSILGPLARHLSAEEIAGFGALDADGKAVIAPERDMKTAQQGAATLVWCAISPLLAGKGGVYCENSDIAPITPPGGPFGVNPWAIDTRSADRLWTLSETLAGIGLREDVVATERP